MKYDFSTSSNRTNTNAEKYSLCKEKFGTTNIIPVWIADMDINSPKFVQEAIQTRLKQPIFGYEEFPPSAFKAQISWLKNNYNVNYDIDDVFYSHSIVASLNVAIEAFSNVGDNIIVQTPIYSPLFTSAISQNREVVFNPLILDENGLYKMDLDSLKKQITPKTKMMMLCNPQNPSGRVWRKDELKELVNICKEHNIIIFSDEVHCDLVYEPFKHIPTSSIKGAKDITISAYGIGKSFNLSGLATSTIYIQNKKLREKYKKVYDKYHFASGNILSHVAFEVAYTHGDDWIKDLKIHLTKNYEMLKEVCDKYPKLLTLMPIQATYLAWIECSGISKNSNEINDFFIKKAKLGLNTGNSFCKENNTYMRLNFAVSTEIMKQIVKQLDSALQSLN